MLRWVRPGHGSWDATPGDRFQEVSAMVPGTDASGKAVAGRWVAPPWNEESPEWIALDEQLPSDHPARWVDAVVGELDLNSFAQRYAGVGSKALPPDLLLKGMLYEMHCQSRLSPAQWTRDCRELGPLRWLLFGLQPSRTCLYNFRDRVGADLDSWQQQLLGKAQAEGCTTAERGAIDGSFTAAYGSRHRLITAQTLEQRWQQLEAAVAADRRQAAAGSSLLEQVLAGLEQAEASTPAAPPTGAMQPQTKPALERAVLVQAEATTLATASAAASAATPDSADQTPANPTVVEPLGPSAAADQPGWLATTPGGRREQRHKYQQARQRMQELQARHAKDNTKRAKRQRRPIQRLLVSPTEPEAALGMDKLKTFRPLYNVQLVYDLDSPLILGHQVFAAVTDHNMLVPVVERTQQLTGQPLQQLLGDAIYASVLDLVWCAEQGITLYSPAGTDATATASTNRRPSKQLSKSAFTWLPEQQAYRCPEGHLLEYARTSQERRGPTQELTVLQYRCAPEHCQACPQQKACTSKPQQGRTIKRSEHEDLVDALRQRMQEPAGKALYKLRKQTVERGFADLKTHRGLYRFRSYGLERARVQVGLLVVMHNALTLLQAREQRSEGLATPQEETG
jgi:transposase